MQHKGMLELGVYESQSMWAPLANQFEPALPVSTLPVSPLPSASMLKISLLCMWRSMCFVLWSVKALCQNQIGVYSSTQPAGFPCLELSTHSLCAIREP